MKRKDYQRPSVRVLQLPVCRQLLAGSTGGTVEDPDDETIIMP